MSARGDHPYEAPAVVARTEIELPLVAAVSGNIDTNTDT